MIILMALNKYVLLWLSSFTWHNIFKIHSCGILYSPFNSWAKYSCVDMPHLFIHQYMNIWIASAFSYYKWCHLLSIHYLEHIPWPVVSESYGNCNCFEELPYCFTKCFAEPSTVVHTCNPSQYLGGWDRNIFNGGSQRYIAWPCLIKQKKTKLDKGTRETAQWLQCLLHMQKDQTRVCTPGTCGDGRRVWWLACNSTLQRQRCVIPWTKWLSRFDLTKALDVTIILLQ